MFASNLDNTSFVTMQSVQQTTAPFLAALYREVRINYSNKIKTDNETFITSKRFLSIDQQSLNYITPSKSKSYTTASQKSIKILSKDINKFKLITEEERIESGFESESEIFINRLAAAKGHEYAGGLLAEIINNSSDESAVESALYILSNLEKTLYQPIVESSVLSLLQNANSSLMERIIDLCDAWEDEESLKIIANKFNDRLTVGVRYYLNQVIGERHGTAFVA